MSMQINYYANMHTSGQYGTYKSAPDGSAQHTERVARQAVKAQNKAEQQRNAREQDQTDIKDIRKKMEAVKMQTISQEDLDHFMLLMSSSRTSKELFTQIADQKHLDRIDKLLNKPV